MSVVWGAMTGMFLEGLVPSLLQPDNFPAAKEGIEEYIIYTDEFNRIATDPRIHRLNKLVPISLRALPAGQNNVRICVAECLERCLHAKRYAYIISPDHIYGNGSVKYMTDLFLQDKAQLILHSCVRTKLSLHGTICGMLAAGQTISNRQLVGMGMAEISDESALGFPIVQESPGVWKVNHCTPNPIFLPDQPVVDFMKSNPTNNSSFDHSLPWHCVQRGMTYYYVDDSDPYFMIEPTDRNFALCQEITFPEGYVQPVAENSNFWAKFTQTWRS